jgi:hypothetical protein
LGEVQAIGDHRGTAIRVDADDHAAVDGLERRIEEVAPDVPHIQLIPPIDDPVAQAEARDAVEVGEGLQGRPIPAVDPPLKGVADQKAAVAPNSEAVRREGQLNRRLQPLVEVRGLDPAIVDVEEPQPAVAPARTFGELQAAPAVDQDRAGVLHRFLTAGRVRGSLEYAGFIRGPG